MSDEVQQAVVDETKVPALPGAAENNAPGKTDDDLDVLLNDPAFKEQPRTATEKTQPDTTTGTDQVKDATAEVLAARDEIRQARFSKDMGETIEKVRGDLPGDFFDKTFVKAWIDARATEDPRLAQAWVQRHENPQKFQQVVGALSKEFVKKYGKLPDKNATEDRELVTAAVRGASTKVPEGKAPDYSGLNNNQFLAEKDKLFG